MNIKERYNRTKEFIEKYKVEIIGCGLVILAVNHNKTLKNLAAASMDHSKAIGRLQNNVDQIDADTSEIYFRQGMVDDRMVQHSEVLAKHDSDIRDLKKVGSRIYNQVFVDQNATS